MRATRRADDAAMAHRRFALFVGPLLATLIFAVIAIGVFVGADRFIRDAQWVAHSNAVIAQVDGVEALLRDAESSQRGYLLTGRVQSLVDYQRGRDALPLRMADLKRMTADNPVQRQRTRELERLIAARLVQMEHTLRVNERDGLSAARAAIDQNVHATSNAIRALTTAMNDAERDLLDVRAETRRESAQWLRGLAIAGIPFGLLVVGLVFASLRRENRARTHAERETAHSNDRLQATVAELERQGGDLRALGTFGSMLQSCMAQEEALQLAARVMARIAPGSSGVVYRMRASQDHAEDAIRWGEQADGLPGMLPPEDCWALRRGQPHVVRIGDMACAHVGDAPASGDTTVCIPLIAQGTQLGLLHFTWTDDGARDVLPLAESASEQLAMALSSLELQERLHFHSIRDALTGLYNRRYLEESLARELARCARRHLPLGLMMFDVDHFKRFNDTQGHVGGDALLAAMGRLLRDSSRPEDIACRYGGEEFTLILPETPPDAVLARAEAIRAAVRAMRVTHEGKALPDVTVSIGVAMFPDDGNAPDALLRLADAALYRAKREGRDRVVAAGAGHD